MISATVKADSINKQGVRLVTTELTYPRFIHAELMTHRDFSRNAASSRAIPTFKKIEAIEKEMAVPVEWGKNQKGMVAEELLTSEEQQMAEVNWRRAGEGALHFAKRLDAMKVHKAICNRITEPWSHITVIVSSTRWSNHQALRDAPDADPTYQVLAKKIREALAGSQPILLEVGSWHLPYITDEDSDSIENLKLISAGRCARVSYLTHDGKRDPREDIALANRIAKSYHMTPFEHQATPIGDWSKIEEVFGKDWCGGCERGVQCYYVVRDRYRCHACAIGHITSGNFFGWHQHRKEFPNECR